MNNQLASALDNEICISASFVDVGEGWRVSGSWGKGNTGIVIVATPSLSWIRHASRGRHEARSRCMMNIVLNQ